MGPAVDASRHAPSTTRRKNFENFFKDPARGRPRQIPDFRPHMRLKVRGAQLSSDVGLLVLRELDDVFGQSDLTSAAL